MCNYKSRSVLNDKLKLHGLVKRSHLGYFAIANREGVHALHVCGALEMSFTEQYTQSYMAPLVTMGNNVFAGSTHIHYKSGGSPNFRCTLTVMMCP